jgi:ribosomal protein S18 acetylase RimI-like enzyme
MSERDPFIGSLDHDGLSDVVEQPLRESFSLHHGTFNSRAYIFSWNPATLARTAEHLLSDAHDDESTVQSCVEYTTQLAIKNHYSKVIVKAPRWAASVVSKMGLVASAVIPKYYAETASSFAALSSGTEQNGDEDDAIFFTAFLVNGALVCPPMKMELSPPPEKISAASDSLNAAAMSSSIRIQECSNPKRIAGLLRKCFITYPFPCFHESYVSDQMTSRSAVYFIAVSASSIAQSAGTAQGELEEDEDIGCSSVEIDLKNRAVEMTDFAVLPSQRGRGVASMLLDYMERIVASGILHENSVGQDGPASVPIRTAFSIARATVPAVNNIFRRAGYVFGGVLAKNTNIGGGLEDMVIWSKQLREK